MTEGYCYVCGAEMRTFDVYDPETDEKVAEEISCPNQWKESHERGHT